MPKAPITYSPTEVAKILKTKLPNVYYWLQKGVIKSIKIGSRYRVTQVQIDNFLKDCNDGKVVKL